IKAGAGDYLTDASTRLDLDALHRLRSETGIELSTVTADDADVHWIERRMATHLEEARSEAGGRWQDVGWWLVIPIALLSALWFRRGWTIRWATYAIFGLGVITARPALSGTFA